MEGAALAAERQHERALMVAHSAAAWTGAAFGGKLKQFSYYRKARPERQNGGQMLAALRTLQDMGAPMTIRQVN